ncbi:MAG: penicillin-binding protein [Flavobacteriales bacterium]|nr:penicillin-binding protein [Flavobacteriales bacterium]
MENINNISKRAWWIFLGMVVLGGAIIVKVFMIQVNPGDRALNIIETYTSIPKEIAAERGQIFTHDGKALTVNLDIYDVYWDSQAAYDISEYRLKVDSLALSLSKLTGRSASHFISIFKNARAEKLRYVKIADSLSVQQIDLFRNFPLVRNGQYKSGFITEKYKKRKRPHGNLAARTVGKDHLTNAVGIEEAYDELLRGKTGKQYQERMAGGVWRPIQSNYIEEPEPGADIYTTLDIHLQDLAHDALLEQMEKHSAAWGCVVLMEVETGMVRAIANLSNQKNSFYTEEYNYAIGASVEPGSTMKLASMMACLDAGLIHLEDSVNTGKGVIEFHGAKMKDSNYDKGGNGTITAEQVFEKSSNIGAALLVKKSFGKNPQKFLDKLHEFGLHESLGICIQGETKPVLYSKTKEEGWSDLSITQLAIGYETQCTPLQTLAFYNAIANDGKLVQPQFVKEIKKNGRTIEKTQPVVLRKSFCKKETLDQCRRMMEGVMEKGGTADWVFKDSPYKAAGKTGTAWLHENGKYLDQRYRASFVGYFPADEPKYSCIVVINDPRSGVYYGSSVAAPVFEKLANRIYATEFDFHEPLVLPDSVIAAEKKILVSKNGDAKALATVFKGLNIPNNMKQGSSWVATSSQKDSVHVSERKYTDGLVPNVQGMGLQDALFLLENSGMKVQVFGYGRVTTQSITPGARIKSNPYISITLS